MADYVEKVHATLTADGDGTAYGYLGPIKTSELPGTLVFQGSGTFGGGTIKLQIQANDGTWKDVTGSSFTEAFDKVLEIPVNNDIRVNLSGSTSPSLYYQLSVRGPGRLFIG